MIYSLTFQFNGKLYANSQTVSEKCLEHQYEAVACGLLLGKLEQEKLSRDNTYLDLCLNEIDGDIVNPVWTAQEYVPTSVEVK